MGLRKVIDTFNDGQSDADKHFSLTELKYFFKLFRPRGIYPKGFETNSQNSELTTIEFNLKGIQFGNWLSTEDKFDYMTAFWIAMHDMNLILRFPSSNLGLSEQLAVTFGSRGIPKALAHYSPKQQVINISRYIDEPRYSKMARFISTGGAGSLAHEYGHFLDYTFGAMIDLDKDFAFLTGASQSTNWKMIEYDQKKNPMRYQMQLILNKALFSVDKKTKKVIYSEFGERMREINSRYYSLKVEIWARIFEKWIAYNLWRQYNIKNTFLTHDEYNSPVYLTDKEMTVLDPLILKLIGMMRKHV